MQDRPSRRDFVQSAAASVLLQLSPQAAGASREADRKLQVVMWDERQPEQKEAYPGFLGDWIARYLDGRPGLAVRSVGLDDPKQGMDDVLGKCAVLLWWGHRRHAEIKPETGKAIVERIKEGKLSLIALHSAHWSTPFMEAMNERARADARQAVRGEKVEFREVPPPRRYTLPKVEDRLTPYTTLQKFPDGTIKAALHLPYCCFPAYRTDGKPSLIRVLKPDHPIARGLPKEFELPRTEMYAEPFHVPEPDEVIFEERWASGDWFRSGSVWKVGAGRVFYFRPGHETFAVYKEKPVLQLLENAIRWLGERPA
jgi:trehalose utilization protein